MRPNIVTEVSKLWTTRIITIGRHKVRILVVFGSSAVVEPLSFTAFSISKYHLDFGYHACFLIVPLHFYSRSVLELDIIGCRHFPGWNTYSVESMNPFHPFEYLTNEYAIRLSGILFCFIVIETSLSGAHTKSVFGLFNVPAKWYPWILLIIFQVLMANVSLLGHLCGIFSGVGYNYGLFSILIPGTSFYTTIEGSPLLSSCIRRPKFIVCTGRNTTVYIPTYTNQNTPASGLSSGNLLRNLSVWMPQRYSVNQSTEESRFRGRALGGGGNPGLAPLADSNLQAPQLYYNNPGQPPRVAIGQHIPNARRIFVDDIAALTGRSATRYEEQVLSAEEIQKIISMGALSGHG